MNEYERQTIYNATYDAVTSVFQQMQGSGALAEILAPGTTKLDTVRESCRIQIRDHEDGLSTSMELYEFCLELLEVLE